MKPFRINSPQKLLENKYSFLLSVALTTTSNNYKRCKCRRKLSPVIALNKYCLFILVVCIGYYLFSILCFCFVFHRRSLPTVVFFLMLDNNYHWQWSSLFFSRGKSQLKLSIFQKQIWFVCTSCYDWWRNGINGRHTVSTALSVVGAIST